MSPGGRAFFTDLTNGSIPRRGLTFHLDEYCCLLGPNRRESWHPASAISACMAASPYNRWGWANAGPKFGHARESAFLTLVKNYPKKKNKIFPKFWFFFVMSV